jgi:hypothetical protein
MGQGIKKTLPFEYSTLHNGTEPCTKFPELASFSYGYNVLDTAGINDPEDLRNMLYLAKFLSKLKHVHGVLLCLPFDFRLDDNLTPALQYYKKFFSRV